MKLGFEELDHNNLDKAHMIDRSDISEDFVDTVDTIMKLTDYGVRNKCVGHTFLVSIGDTPVGVILLGEAIPWETDPPEVKETPFYRLMGFVVDKDYRRQGLGKIILEETIRRVYSEFGERPIVLGCHKDNFKAAAFYERHGFSRTDYMEGNDIYYVRNIAGWRDYKNIDHIEGIVHS